MFKSNLFVSASMGEPLLGDILKQAGNEVLVVRGIHAPQQNLAVAFRQWQMFLSRSHSTASVHIDPITFQQDKIDRVPALSLQVDRKTELTAFGVTSTDWLKRQYQAGWHGNPGIHGETYPINEPDLLEVLYQRLNQQDWQAVQAKAHRRLQRKILSFGAKLPSSRQASSKVLNISDPWHTPIIALDINDQQQQKAAMPWLLPKSRYMRQSLNLSSNLKLMLSLPPENQLPNLFKLILKGLLTILKTACVYFSLHGT